MATEVCVRQMAQAVRLLRREELKKVFMRLKTAGMELKKSPGLLDFKEKARWNPVLNPG